MEELFKKYNIRQCYIKLERCDGGKLNCIKYR